MALWGIFLLAPCVTKAQPIPATGKIHFISNAPLEIIEAESAALKGVIEPETGKFAFSIPINSFLGFNSELQREHFNENYMESDRYTRATFAGRIVEDITQWPDVPGEIRARGVLNIHGVEVARTIQITLSSTDNTIAFTSQFEVPLSDHAIEIPRVVHQKIAESIRVTVSGIFTHEAVH